MKGSVEHGNLQNIVTKHPAGSTNPFQIVGVVKWCELDTIFDSLQDLIVNQSRFFEQFSTMDNAMAYRVNVSFASNPELSDCLSEIFWTRYSRASSMPCNDVVNVLAAVLPC